MSDASSVSCHTGHAAWPTAMIRLGFGSTNDTTWRCCVMPPIVLAIRRLRAKSSSRHTCALPGMPKPSPRKRTSGDGFAAWSGARRWTMGVTLNAAWSSWRNSPTGVRCIREMRPRGTPLPGKPQPWPKRHWQNCPLTMRRCSVANTAMVGPPRNSLLSSARRQKRLSTASRGYVKDCAKSSYAFNESTA